MKNSFWVYKVSGKFSQNVKFFEKSSLYFASVQMQQQNTQKSI